MTKTALSTFLVAICTLWAGSAAAAEPPLALGPVAVVEPVPMECENGVCDAVVFVFFPQQHRRSPFSTDIYGEAKRGGVRVVGLTFAGLEVTLPSDVLAFQPDLEYAAVKVSFLTSSGPDIDPSSVRLTISPGTSLAPLDITSDKALKTAIGVYREVAQTFFENGNCRSKTARLVNL